MKRLTIIICLLTALSVQAQENKGAQLVHKAFVEFVYKFSAPQAPPRTLIPLTVEEGLLPDGKQHVVKTSKRNAISFPHVKAASHTWAATQYMQGWAFSINAGLLEPYDPFPLRDILSAFEKSISRSSSCYSYTVGQGQSVFPGVMVEYGPRGGNKSDVAFSNNDNVRLISFTDADGFRSTFLLRWKVEPHDPDAVNIDYSDLKSRGGEMLFNHLEGMICWWYCPASQHPVAPWEMDDDDRDYFFKSSAGFGDSETPGDSENARLSGTSRTTDRPVITPDNEVQLDGLDIGSDAYHVAYNTLLAKVKRMEQLVENSNTNEKLAISVTLDRVCREYTALLSPWQLEELCRHIAAIRTQLKENPEEYLDTNADNILREKLNHTPDMASLRARDQAYLNARGFHLLRHDVCHDHVTYDGQYYTGDEIVSYLDTYDSESEQKYHAEKIVTGLAPGRYCLTVAVRASGRGAFIYALGDHDEKYLAEIPPFYTEGGNIWADACKRIEQLEAEGRADEISGYDRRLASANNGKGFGWTRLTIDDIIVRDGTLKFGVSTLPEFTGKPLQATWFSACDFEFRRTSD